MLKFHVEKNADFIMCLTKQNPDGEYGRVKLNADNTIKDLKAQTPCLHQYTNAGVYIIKRELLTSQTEIDCSSLREPRFAVLDGNKEIGRLCNRSAII